MAITASSVLPDNSLEDFRIEFNNLVTDVDAIQLANTFGVSITFEGATTDQFETSLGVVDPTADNSILLPNVSGNVLLGTLANPDSADGAALGSATLEWSDLYLADGGVIYFGADQDVTLTHVADTGLLLNSTRQLQFNDSSQYISGASATKLDIRATDEIELTSTLVDIVGALTVSGTTTLNGALVLGDAAADTLTVNATLQGASPLTFEGGTADGYETTFAITDPTADRTITFPNLTGTVSLLDATETLTNKTLTAPTINGVVGGTQTSATITTLTTTTVNASGVITGSTVEATGDTAAGDNAAIGYTSAEGLILTGQGSTSDLTVKNDADGTVFTVPTGTDDILFPDNAKAMWGAGSDLQIYHDGSNSYIKDSGTGHLYISGTQVNLRATNNDLMFNGIEDGAVTLYYDNAAKFATSSTGATVTGTVTATAFAGPLTGNVTGNASGTAATVTTAAQTAITSVGTLTALTVSGDISGGTINATGDTAADDNAAIGYTSAEGLILTGQGSTNDVTIKNDADAAVISVPTGTTNVTIAGDLTVSGDDLTMGTNTSGAALIADGTNFNPVVISGDISISTSGVAAIGSGVIATADIADDAVTLAKMAAGTDGNIISFDTSGNPVAVATGTDGQVLTSSGAGTVCAFEDAAGGGYASMQVFTSTGTWTRPSDIIRVVVIVTAGGGGGGGTPNDSQRGGGAGGGTAIETIDVSGTSSAAVTVGAAGAAGAANGNDGGAGGASSFASFCSATGGAGGEGSTAPGSDIAATAGGTGSGGDINLKGGDAYYFARSAVANWGGPPTGGGSYWGPGGVGQYRGSSVGGGTTGTYGTGGGGSSTAALAGGYAGAAGGAGLVVVYEYK